MVRSGGVATLSWPALVCVGWYVVYRFEAVGCAAAAYDYYFLSRRVMLHMMVVGTPPFVALDLEIHAHSYKYDFHLRDLCLQIEQSEM